MPSCQKSAYRGYSRMLSYFGEQIESTKTPMAKKLDEFEKWRDDLRSTADQLDKYVNRFGRDSKPGNYPHKDVSKVDLSDIEKLSEVLALTLKKVLKPGCFQDNVVDTEASTTTSKSPKSNKFEPTESHDVLVEETKAIGSSIAPKKSKKKKKLTYKTTEDGYKYPESGMLDIKALSSEYDSKTDKVSRKMMPFYLSNVKTLFRKLNNSFEVKDGTTHDLDVMTKNFLESYSSYLNIRFNPAYDVHHIHEFSDKYMHEYFVSFLLYYSNLCMKHQDNGEFAKVAIQSWLESVKGGNVSECLPGDALQIFFDVYQSKDEDICRIKDQVLQCACYIWKNIQLNDSSNLIGKFNQLYIYRLSFIKPISWVYSLVDKATKHTDISFLNNPITFNTTTYQCQFA